ncbi:MAG: M24 family metallopeptidase [Bacillota bacterium]
MDYAKRLENLRAAMLEQEIDSIIYGTGANFQYFTGLLVPWRRMDEPTKPSCFLVVSGEGEPLVILDSESAHLAETSPFETVILESLDKISGIAKARLSGRTIGANNGAMEYISEIVRATIPQASIVSADELGEKMRVIKEPEETALLRKAAELAGNTLEKVVPFIKPGITRLELQEMISSEGQALGADAVSFSPAALFVKSGTKPSENPFTYPAEEGLVPGASIAFDYGFLVDGYCSDFGRSFYCGPAPEDFVKAYSALQTAQTELVSRLEPWKTNLGEMFGMLESIMDQLGYGDRLRARLTDGTLGHQIGVDVHENPWIRPTTNAVLRPGMVMAIEPKVWLPGEYYLRVEDIVLITENGAEFLTSFDRALFELAL